MKVDPWYKLIEIKHRSKAYVNDAFVLAQQAIQVYYTLFPSIERGKKDWCAEYEVKSWAVHYELKEEEEEPHVPEYFQKDETSKVH